MGIADRSHGVNFEVLVGTDLRDLLDGTPVGERGLGIVEPLVAHVSHVVVVNVSNTSSDLTSVNSSVEEQELGTNFLVALFGALGKHELVVEGIAATDNLNIVKIVRVDGGEADTAVVHLTGEDLVTVEEVAEDAAVTVSVVVAVGHSDINEVTQKSVHRVVLLLDIVEVLSMLVDAVLAEHVLEEEETVVVGILDAGGVVEHTNVGVDHLVVSDEQESGDVDGALSTGGSSLNGLAEGVEVLVNLLNESLVVEVTSTDNDKVVTVVVAGVVVAESVGVEVLNLIAVTLNRLAHHVLSVHVEVNVLHGGLLVSGVVGLVLVADFLLEELKLGGVEVAVADGITKKSDGLVHVTLENLKLEAGALALGLSVVASTHGLDLLGEVGLAALRSAAEEHSLEGVGSTSGLESVLAGASTNVDTDGGHLAGALLSDDADAV